MHRIQESPVMAYVDTPPRPHNIIIQNRIISSVTHIMIGAVACGGTGYVVDMLSTEHMAKFMCTRSLAKGASRYAKVSPVGIQ
jgi:hypothetical protein